MSETAAVLGASLPSQATSPIYGANATANRAKLEELIVQKENDGGWNPAMVLNLSPFNLRVEHGLVQSVIPTASKGKDFSFRQITTARPYLKYRATHERNGGIVERDYDVLALSPIEQAYEFFHTYNLTSETEGAMGGVVVFEGTEADLKDPKAKVRVPYVAMQGKIRVLKFREELLAVVIKTAQETMKTKALREIQQGQTYFDDPNRRNYLTDEHRTWAQLAFSKRWIPALPSWMSASSTAGTVICDGCSQEYRSRTGKCQCGHVQEILKAYQNSVIEYGHVRMDAMTPEEWKEAKRIKAEREKARGSN